MQWKQSSILGLSVPMSNLKYSRLRYVQIYGMMLGCFSDWRIASSLRVVWLTPSSSFSRRMILTAKICWLVVSTALKTSPQEPSPSLLTIWKLGVESINQFQMKFIVGRATSNLPQHSQPLQLIQMKHRWKILIASLIILGVLSCLFLFLGSSFKQVGLREFGIAEYTFYNTVDPTQTVRSSGNYLAGLDFSFITYPRGILKHQFTVTTLTKDKSMISMQGLLLGQLIESEVLSMHFNYADQYMKLAGKAAEQAFRQSLELFLLTEIISSRASVNAYISSNVCLSVESKYSFINCRYVSTGSIHLNAAPVVLTPENTVQEYLKNMLEKTIGAQKRMNVYGNGGFDLIQNVENMNSQLFLNSSKLIVETVGNYTSDGSEIFAGSAYVLSSPLIPLLSNSIPSVAISDS